MLESAGQTADCRRSSETIAFVGPELIKGMIVRWSGSIVSIPEGYALCNGANGTPDLRNKFVVGAGDTYNPDASGGNINHNHDFTGNGHTHDLVAGTGLQT